MNRATLGYWLQSLFSLYYRIEPHQSIDGLSVAKRTVVHHNCELAERRMAEGRVLREAGMSGGTVVLLKQAAVLLVHAYLVLRDQDFDPTRFEPESLVERLARRLAQPNGGAPPEWERCMVLLCMKDEELPSLPEKEQAARAVDLDVLTTWLWERVAPQSEASLRATRRWRVGMAVVGLLCAALAYPLWRICPTNVALNKLVTASPADKGTLPSAVVDDRLYGAYGFFSQRQQGPWVLIDLGRTYAITDAEVYGRRDCCYDESVPLTFELSDDGKVFRTVRTLNAPSTLLKTWIIAAIDDSARFVRLRTLKNAPLVLTEVVVNGYPVE